MGLSHQVWSLRDSNLKKVTKNSQNSSPAETDPMWTVGHCLFNLFCFVFLAKKNLVAMMKYCDWCDQGVSKKRMRF